MTDFCKELKAGQWLKVNCNGTLFNGQVAKVAARQDGFLCVVGGINRGVQVVGSAS